MCGPCASHVFRCFLPLVYIFCLHVLSGATHYLAQNSVESDSNDSLPSVSRLQHLHILFRHGDRTPIHDMLHTSVPFEKTWPLGPGQLTEKGIVQEFQLGQWIRQRYNEYIPSMYNGSELHMRSTDVDRTLMSAQAVAAGIYQNASSPLQDYGIPWRPIPVHTVRQLQYASTPDILRLEIGVFLDVFVHHLKSITNATNSSTVQGHQLSVQHTMAYSAHDTDVTYLLGAFGAFNNETIPYSAAIVFELIGPDPPSPIPTYQLRLNYKRGYLDTVGEYRTMAPCTGQPGESGCPLDLVLSYLESYSLDPDEFSQVCTGSSSGPWQCVSNPSSKHLLSYTITGVLVCMCVVGILIFFITACRSRRRRHRGTSFAQLYPTF
ncbi:histidine acid phosphatase [Opisthorchis viverrini]|uniref:acid phosphatase n=1 Tax=Opisthorchis viverrini TaxID=6198 RepID=A0A1S8WN45_OPIVI|nr:histidine acid phosphatase [Opisthorchis viverrini]